MLIKNNLSLKTNKFYRNLNKTKKVFNSFKIDLKNFQIPLLQSYKKGTNITVKIYNPKWKKC